MNRPIRWGVLGTAAIAVQRTIPAMHAAQSATLLALASRDADRCRGIASALSIPRAYGSYEALLADPDIDAIYLPLPNQLHFEWSVRALEAGKHVLCEKPLCLRASDVAELCAVRDRTGRTIEEAFAFRNHPQWAKIAGLIAADGIGAVRSVHAMLAKQFLDPADIRNNPAAGGGALYDLGSYAISACNLVFGRMPQRVVAAIDRDPRLRHRPADQRAVRLRRQPRSLHRGHPVRLRLLGHVTAVQRARQSRLAALQLSVRACAADGLPGGSWATPAASAPCRRSSSNSSPPITTCCRSSDSRDCCWASPCQPGRSRRRWTHCG